LAVSPLVPERQTPLRAITIFLNNAAVLPVGQSGIVEEDTRKMERYISMGYFQMYVPGRHGNISMSARDMSPSGDNELQRD